VRVLSAGAGAVRFAVDVPAASLGAVPDAGGASELRIPGYANGGMPGAPALPSRVVLVAVPPGAEVSLSATAGAGEPLEGVVLAEAGPAAGGGANRMPRTGRTDATGAPAPARARLIGVSWMRDQRVASIAILPAEYDAAARRVTLYREIEVEVVFGGGASATSAPAPSADPFENVYRASVVNYEAGRAWRRPHAAGSGAASSHRLRALMGPGDLGVSTVPDTSLFVGRDWIKIAVTKTGFYRVNFGQLRTKPLFASLPGGAESATFDQLRMFVLPGYPVLPEDNYCDACEYREVAIQTVESTCTDHPTPDGVMNCNADAFVFFALGPNDWADYYDPAQPESVFVDHPYETRNYYYLGVSTTEQPIAGTPVRFTTRSGAVTDDGTEIHPVDFAARVHAEQDIEYLPDLCPNFFDSDPGVFWEKWFWRSMQLGGEFSPDVDTPGADSTKLATVRIRQWGIQSGSQCGTDTQHFLDVSVNGQPMPREGWQGQRGIRPFAYIADIPINALKSRDPNEIKVSIPAIAGCPGRIDRSALAWIEVRYRRKFEPVGDELTFDSPASGGNYIYDIGPFAGTDAPRVFDVTDAYAPAEITPVGWSNASGRYRLSFETVEGGPRRYRVIPSATIAGVADASIAMAPSTSRLNLRSHTRAADYLLIYYDGFQAAADSLAAWRADHLPIDGGSPPFDVFTIPISALYDQFSGGRTDPSAIRNFMRATSFSWQKPPTFVTFLGDASYDFKNIKGLSPAGQPGALVPTYENGFAQAGEAAKQFTTDDWLLNVDNPTLVIPDFFGGRIPAADSRSALDFVLKKVLFYERQAPAGTWRDKVMLIADDNKQGDRPDILGWAHLQQTAGLDNSHMPSHVDREYVYLHTYPDGPGATKPDAKAAIKENVNEGVLMFNFIGHGSPFKISDETVLSDVDAGTFTNAQRPTLFVAASCDVGKFSDPTVQSLGERMVLAPNGGAVAVVSATEIAYSSLNVDLNSQFYDELFNRDPANGQYHESIGQALFTAKVLTSNNDPFRITNNSKYQVMGDPATRLLTPRLWVDVTLHACETCTDPITEVKRGQTTFFRGQVLDREGGSPVALDGTADLLIEDSAPLDAAPTDPSIEYWFRAGPMFRGDVAVAGGVLQGSFVVPIEAKGGARGRVRAYVSGRTGGYDTDGVGSIYVQVSPGPPVTGDEEGPRITLSFASGSTIVKPDAQLRVDLQDPSGILITGHTLQNGIVVTLDENTTARVDITPSFRYLNGSHTNGNAYWTLPNLGAGAHTIKVSAADNLAAGLTASQHRSSATIGITVAETPPLQIVHAYLFPNPTQSGRSTSGGQFVVDALGDSVNTLLKIYTISGRMIRSIESFGRQGQIQIPWDGLDHEGHPLANGTYFFRVQLNVRDELGESSTKAKAASEGRFVILNR